MYRRRTTTKKTNNKIQRRRPTKTKAKVSKGVKARTFKKRVRSTIKSMAEKKQTFYNDQDEIYGAPADAAFVTENIQLLTPANGGSWNVAVQGTGQGQRVGNEIQVVSHIYKAVVTPYGAGVVNPVLLRCLIVSPKRLNDDNATAIATICQGRVFQQGSSAVGMSNDITDMIQDYNDDLLNIHYCKTFKLGQASPGTSSVSIGNNDFDALAKVRINLLKYLPKKYKYDDGSAIPGVNKNYYMLWHVARIDGANNGLNTTFARVSHFQQVRYIDM